MFETLFEDAKKLNKNNIKEFIKEYGVINDISLAQNLLIINPNTWNVISSHLKRLPEVIVFYQPVGFIIKKDYEDIGELEPTLSNILVPNGFAMTELYELFPMDIPWPDFFDSQIYFDIQNYVHKNSTVFDALTLETTELLKNTKFSFEDQFTRYDFFTYNIDYLINQDSPNIKTGYPPLYEFHIFDRTKIREAVNMCFVDKNEKKK